ncbi:type II toxin-antitoxin system RelE/ParE family toxin [Salinimicrobium sp. GXAS 041]|uniref:type II toxin-antitoxin system RelE/ParE family toxin n=1 Tax=Salinimicrobium sp. GXAS 041 TaxID=3400806 RepID=UPI003C794624
MVFKLLVREEAQREIIDAGFWYENKQKGLGRRFVSEVEDQFEFVLKFPEVYALKKDNFREAPLKEFPYSIIYTLENRKITVFAVFNTYQNPTKKP